VGIRYDTLYGDPPATGDEPAQLRGRPGLESAARLTIVVPAGDAPPDVVPLTFVARSMQIDNATGRWFRIGSRWIPPWTVGAIVTVDPPTAELVILATTPPGQLSARAGDELVVIAHDIGLDPHPGLAVPPSGGAGFSLVHTRLGFVATTSGGPPATHDIFNASELPAGTRVAVRRLRAQMSYRLGGNRHEPTHLSVGWINIAALLAEEAELVVSWDEPHPPEFTYDPPLLWPSPDNPGVGNAGIWVIGRQQASAPPSSIGIEADYLFVEDE